MTKEKGAASSPSNTEIWDNLEKTNPKYTKGFQKAGGNSGTSINPTYVYKKLTQQFGPCGIGWGYEEISSEYVEGQHTYNSKTDKQIIHVVKINLWHGSKENTIMGVGTTTFVGTNKHGLFTDEEFYKKSVTDALTNAAKMIGCSADIFMGLYDDNKYVNQITDEFNKPEPTKSIKVQVLGYVSKVKVKEDWKKIKEEMQKNRELVKNWKEVSTVLAEAHKAWTNNAPPTNQAPMTDAEIKVAKAELAALSQAKVLTYVDPALITEAEKKVARAELVAESKASLNEDEVNDRRMNG